MTTFEPCESTCPLNCLPTDVSCTYTAAETENGESAHTPEDTDLNSISIDSGFDGSLNLQCLESVLDWRCKKYPLSVARELTFTSSYVTTSPEHRGFENYLEDIYLHRLSLETKYHVTKFLNHQSEVTPCMRGTLISWLSQIHHQLYLNPETLFLSVSIIDRVFSVMRVSRDCLQLLGITSLLLSSKLEEVTPPEIQELLPHCGDSFNRCQVKQLERVILSAIKFDLLVPTSQFFLEQFASTCIKPATGFRADQLREARSLARFTLELTLQDYELCQYRPSLLALCAWKISVEKIGQDDGHFFPSGLYFTRNQYGACFKDMKAFIDNLLNTCPDIWKMCEHYTNMYGMYRESW